MKITSIKGHEHEISPFLLRPGVKVWYGQVRCWITVQAETGPDNNFDVSADELCRVLKEHPGEYDAAYNRSMEECGHSAAEAEEKDRNRQPALQQ